MGIGDSAEVEHLGEFARILEMQFRNPIVGILVELIHIKSWRIIISCLFPFQIMKIYVDIAQLVYTRVENIYLLQI